MGVGGSSPLASTTRLEIRSSLFLYSLLSTVGVGDYAICLRFACKCAGGRRSAPRTSSLASTTRLEIRSSLVSFCIICKDFCANDLQNAAPVLYYLRFGRLTQLGECLLDVEEVTGSSPVSSTTWNRGRTRGSFSFA